MSKVRLTDTTVASLTCSEGRKDALFFDAELKGFGVRIATTGQRTFLFQYRVGPVVRRMPLGVFGVEVTTKQARMKAERLRGVVVDGRDPVAERDTAKRAAIVAEAEAKLALAETAFTLRHLIEEWERLHLLGLRQSYRRDAMGRLRLHLAGSMDRGAATLTRSDAVRELDRIAIEAGETTARRVMGYARSAYGWARRRGSVETNPFEDLPPMGREVRRERVLSDAEIGRIWNAAAALGPAHGGFARFLLLTLARREEAARMSWSEISADLSTWTLPAVRAKNGKAHVVHLAESARAILADLRRGEASDLVFVTPSGKGLTTFSYIARKLAQYGEVEGWRLHDFRRSGVTALAAIGFSPHVCDRLLGHAQGTIRGVAAIYQRHDFAAERKAALDAWAAHVLACASGDAGTGSNVVRLSRAGQSVSGSAQRLAGARAARCVTGERDNGEDRGMGTARPHARGSSLGPHPDAARDIVHGARQAERQIQD